MGTSKNVASPDSPPWKFALAVLGRPEIPVHRQNREIWRSVAAEHGHLIADDFSHPVLATACKLASVGTDVRAVMRSYEHQLTDSNKSGFAVEVARRALARAVNAKQGAEGFACELFAEATSYYASRDLPSFVGSKDRVKTTSGVIALKSELKATTRSIVQSVGSPSVDPEGWSNYVSQVIKRLEGGR